MAYTDDLITDGAGLVWKFNETLTAGVEVFTATNDGSHTGTATESSNDGSAGDAASTGTGMPGSDGVAIQLEGLGYLQGSTNFFTLNGQGSVTWECILAVHTAYGDLIYQDADEFLTVTYNNSNGRLDVAVHNGAAPVNLSTANSSISLNTLYHVAVVVNSTGDTRLLLNGVLADSATLAAGGIEHSNVFTLGNVYGVSALSMTVQSFALYPSVVADATLLAHYNAAITPGATTEYETVQENFVFGNPAPVLAHLLADGLLLTTVNTPNIITVLKDAFSLSDALVKQMTLKLGLSEAVLYADLPAMFVRELVSDLLNYADTTDRNQLLIKSIIDKIKLTENAQARQTLQQSLVVALTLADLADNFFRETLAETLNIIDVVTHQFRLNEALVESLIHADTTAFTAYIKPLVADSYTFVESVTPSQTLQALLEDGISFSFYFNNDQESYSGWVLNASNSGISNYSDYNYNSIAKIGKEYYGASRSGIYKLTGTADSALPWVARLGAFSPAGENKSRVPEAFIGIENNGKIVLKTTTGKQEERWYELRPSQAEMDVRRAKMGRGVTSHYWQFTLENIDGTDTELQFIELHPVKLTRRV